VVAGLLVAFGVAAGAVGMVAGEAEEVLQRQGEADLGGGATGVGEVPGGHDPLAHFAEGVVVALARGTGVGNPVLGRAGRGQRIERGADGGGAGRVEPAAEADAAVVQIP